MKIQYSLLLLLLLSGFTQCKSPTVKSGSISDEALMDTIQRRTFNYFWEGAEPNSGLACERIHMDGIYPEDDQHVVTTGGSGFGIMAILAGIDRGYISTKRSERALLALESRIRLGNEFSGIWLQRVPHHVHPCRRLSYTQYSRRGLSRWLGRARCYCRSP